MTKGIVRIYLSVVEPEDKNLLWMRPFLDKEGYELLYFGSTGWIKWLPCCSGNKDNSEEDNTPDIKDPCDCFEID